MQDIKFATGLATAADGRSAFYGTPFVGRTAGLNENALWMRWDRAMVVDTYTDVVEELEAIRGGVAMGDMSPLSKYTISGPDAAEMLDRLMPRDIHKLRIGQIYYTPWCTEEGHVVGDGLVFRMDEETFRISADPGLAWWKQHADGLNVEVNDVTEHFGILTLQGPSSRAVLEAAIGAEFQELPFSRFAVVTVAGRKIEVLRQGFTGEHGYELWVPACDATAVWDAIAMAGRAFNIRPAGAWALDLARLEAGLLIVGYDYTSAGPDRGGAAVHAVDRYRATPFDLGLGRLIDFRKANFSGRASLEKIAQTGRHRRLVGLEIDWKGVGGSQAPAPGSLRRVRWQPLPIISGDTEIGFASSIAWSPTLNKLIGFGHLEYGQADEGQSLALRWPIDGALTEVAARIVELPFLSLRRAAES